MSELTLAYTHTYTADLTAPLRVQRLPDAVPAGDGNAHLFRVALGEQAPESALAYALRPDGVTVIIPCALEEDSLSFLLPAEALAEPGRVDVLLRGFGGDCVTTLLWCSLTVRPGLTDSLTDPEELVPSLEELLARVADCEAAAAEAREAASACAGQVTAAEAAAGQACTAAAAMTEELTPVLTRMDALEASVGAADTALAAHGGRLTALEARTAADTLAELFCPAFSGSGSLVTCYPVPGSTVMLTLDGEDTAFHTSTRALWSCSGFAGGETYYYLTGGNGGGDVAIPAGTWTFSWSFTGLAATDSYSVYCRVGAGSSARRVNTYGPTGSVTVTASSPTTVSVWLYKTAAGWATLGYPTVTAMLADGTMAELGSLTHSAGVQAAASFISPQSHEAVLVWTEDGSSLTAAGREDLPHALAALREAMA